MLLLASKQIQQSCFSTMDFEHPDMGAVRKHIWCVAVFQLESLASFSAVIDRLGEFEEVINAPKAAQAIAAQPGSLTAAADVTGNGTSDSAAVPTTASSVGDVPQLPVAAGDAAALAHSEQIEIVDESAANGSVSSSGGDVLLELAGVTLRTPDGSATLVQNLDVQVSFQSVVGYPACLPTACRC